DEQQEQQSAHQSIIKTNANQLAFQSLETLHCKGQRRNLQSLPRQLNGRVRHADNNHFFNESREGHLQVGTVDGTENEEAGKKHRVLANRSEGVAEPGLKIAPELEIIYRHC